MIIFTGRSVVESANLEGLNLHLSWSLVYKYTVHNR